MIQPSLRHISLDKEIKNHSQNIINYHYNTNMSNLKGKAETEIEIKANPEQYYNIWKRAHHIPNIACDHIQGVDVHEGEWHSHGGVKSWKYTVDGISGVFKEKVEFDDENRAVILNGLEGDVFKEYKSYKPIYQVLPNPKGHGSLVKLSIEYEKLHEGIPPPDKYVKLMVNISKDLDIHFNKE